ncbi:MAG: ABC transporter substrate-binding protein [Pseudomonadota bacterium]|nr:ABC transporter substrate-binding protein [Pseudomonadota bacterium]|tara:strand:- start:67799 stop:68962 length:1164 start_codon:yes stop_codon:yes gene_type:complete
MKISKKLIAQTLSVCMMFGSAQVFADTVKVGMSAAFSGPTAALGNGVKSGVEAYFKEINAKGGINGNTLELVGYDDGYEPAKASPNMEKLIDQDNVIAVIGNVGTPTAVVTVPIANEKKTLLFGAFTGAGLLRKSPPDRYIINYRASYADETSAMIQGLMSSGIKPEEIAFFTQNDGYGDAGYNGAVKALKDAGFAGADSLAHGRYTRNTTNVESGLATILDAEVEPKAVIMVGAYAPCAKFIQLAKEDLPDTHFLNVSFVGSAALLKTLGDDAENVIVTQVVPHPESDLAGVQDYQSALSAYDSSLKPDFVSLEGYIAAKLFAEGLKKAGTADREGVIDGLLSLGDIDIGIGETLNISSNNRQASHKVWPTIIKDGKYVELDWGSL